MKRALAGVKRALAGVKRALASDRWVAGRARGGAPRAAARCVPTALLALVLAVPPACHREGSTGGTLSPPPSGAPATAAPRPPSPRLTDPRWRLAAGDDPLELARLAEAEGATGLLAALDDGGEIERTALRALPYADDAELGLAPLAERARAAPVASLAPLLEALLGIAGRPPRPREPLDPDGIRVAAAVLIELSGRRDLPAEVRALAISAARALADKGLLDSHRIPADLDPDIPAADTDADQGTPP